MAAKQGHDRHTSGRAGWSREETELLFWETDRAAAAGQPVKQAFEAVAQKTGRQPNSIRNYYYMKLREEPGRAKAAFVPFGEKELRMLAEAMLIGRAEGKSVRSIALQLGNGEKKAMLRYQNKYRGLMRANPGYLQNVLRELQAEGRLASGVTLATKRRKRPSVEQTLAELADNLAQLGKDGEAVLYGLNNIISLAAAQKEGEGQTKLLSQLSMQCACNQELEGQLRMLGSQSQPSFSQESGEKL